MRRASQQTAPHHDFGNLRRELFELQSGDARNRPSAKLLHSRVPVRGSDAEQVVEQALAILRMPVERSMRHAGHRQALRDSHGNLRRALKERGAAHADCEEISLANDIDAVRKEVLGEPG
jgi:hypothetical protein